MEQMFHCQLLWPLEQSPVGSADTREDADCEQWGKSTIRLPEALQGEALEG